MELAAEIKNRREELGLSIKEMSDKDKLEVLDSCHEFMYSSDVADILASLEDENNKDVEIKINKGIPDGIVK